MAEAIPFLMFIMIHIICQVGMVVLGGLSIYLVSMKNEWMRWGYIVGMLGQPFWFIMEIRTEQYGLLALTVFYTYSWGKGIYNYWIKDSDGSKGK